MPTLSRAQSLLLARAGLSSHFKVERVKKVEKPFFRNSSKYPSYQQAVQLIIQHKVNSGSYRRLYKSLGLPPELKKAYQEWIGWASIWPPRQYLSETEFKKVLIEHGISSRRMYHKWRKTQSDPRLPTEPLRTYRTKWNQLYPGAKTRRHNPTTILTLEDLVQILRDHELFTIGDYQWWYEKNFSRFPGLRKQPYLQYKLTWRQIQEMVRSPE